MKLNIFKLLFSTAIILGLASCSDFLEQPILGENSDNPGYYDNIDNADMAVIACYNALTIDDDKTAFQWVFGDVMSDDAIKGGNGLGDQNEINYIKDWSTSSNNKYINNTWNAYFIAIYRANLVIKRMAGVTFEEKTQKRFIAEAKFIRAYSYFTLTKLFGDLPLMTEPLEPSQVGKMGRSPYADVLALIEQDLKEAAEDLPEAYAITDVGRATKYAAQGLHARVVMYAIGMFKTKQTTAWQEVYDLTGNIISSGYYSLLPNYAEIFEDEGENCSESIFEIQYETTNTGYDHENQGSGSGIYVANRGTDSNPSWGWGFNCPTKNLVNEFESNDPRLFCTIHGQGITDYLYGVKHDVGQGSHLTGYHARKLAIDPAIRPSNQSDSPYNTRVIRFSDILLMRAEAAFHLGKEAECREYINKVRARARTSTYPKGFEYGTNNYKQTGFVNNLADVTASGANLLKALKHERRVELGMEALRYFDLVRWGDYRATLPTEVQTRFDARQLRGLPVLPIPMDEVVSWGLEQNPS